MSVMTDTAVASQPAAGTPMLSIRGLKTYYGKIIAY